jgi:hypothetical protein
VPDLASTCPDAAKRAELLAVHREAFTPDGKSKVLLLLVLLLPLLLLLLLPLLPLLCLEFALILAAYLGAVFSNLGAHT